MRRAGNDIGVYRGDSDMTDDRLADLYRQGFMKPPKKRRGPAKSKEENAREIEEKTGITVYVVGDEYRIDKPDGSTVYPGGKKTQTLEIARMIQKDFSEAGQ